MKPEDEDIQRLSRLYKLTVHVNEPNLFFVGMAKYGPHFRLSNFQSQLVSAILTKNCSLPHKEAMLKDIEEDFRDKTQLGVPVNHIPWFYPSHYFLKRCQDSILEMVEPGCIEKIPGELMEYWDYFVLAATAQPNDYRRRRYPLDIKWKGIPQQNHIKFNAKE